MSEPIVNNYEKRTVSRVVCGVAASLLSMAIPCGICEAIRPGGDRVMAGWCAVMTVGCIICTVVLVKGGFKE